MPKKVVQNGLIEYTGNVAHYFVSSILFNSRNFHGFRNMYYGLLDLHIRFVMVSIVENFAFYCRVLIPTVFHFYIVARFR